MPRQNKPTPLTNGFLPLSAFEHVEPTDVAIIDLEDGVMPRDPTGVGVTDASRDMIALVRLHGQPLGVIHIPERSEDADPDLIADTIWRSCGAAIASHVRAQACLPSVIVRDALLDGSLAAPGCGDRQSFRPSASIVVPTRGRPTLLRRCLESLSRLEYPAFDVIVVQNGEDDGATRTAFSPFASDSRFRLLREDRPGSSVARNRGIAETDAEIIAFTDDDVVVDPKWLDWLIAPFEDPAVDASTGMVMPLMLQSEAQKRFEQFAGFSRGVNRRTYGLHANRADDRLLFPYWGGMFGSGNSMAFRRRPFVSIGGFDPVLGAGSPTLSGADIDAMSKSILHGGMLVYEPRSVCWHEHRHDTEALRKQLYNYGAGFTAILTKAATSDREFYASARRSVPVMVKLMIDRRNAPPEQVAATLPAEYSSLGRQGMLRGPILYARGKRWAKKLKLEDVIAGG